MGELGYPGMIGDTFQGMLIPAATPRATVVPRSVGPNYLEAGLSMYSDFGGDFFV